MLNDRAHSKHESDKGEKLLKEALQSAEEKNTETEDVMQRNRYLYICIYSQSQCKFGKLMFKLTSIFPPLSLSGSSTYSSFTLQWMEKRKKKKLEMVRTENQLLI